jgi:hypothetical protein
MSFCVHVYVCMYVCSVLRYELCQSPFLKLCSEGLFDILRQSPREILHLLLYNVHRPFANAVHSRYLNAEGQEEFGYRLKSVQLARGWAPITFNISVRSCCLHLIDCHCGDC